MALPLLLAAAAAAAGGAESEFPRPRPRDGPARAGAVRDLQRFAAALLGILLLSRGAGAGAAEGGKPPGGEGDLP